MSNRLASAHEALWTLMHALFTDVSKPQHTAAERVVRNPEGLVTKAVKGAPATLYVVMEDDDTPEVINVLLGPVFDLQVKPRIGFAFLGDEAARRPAQWACVDQLAAALAADRTLGGAVSYAELEPAERADADALPWLAGGMVAPVRLLFDAPTRAG